MSYYKAMLTRVIFTLHSLFAIYIVTIVTADTRYWTLALAVAPLLIESTITINKRKGKELKWVCPSVFFYLMSVVPSVWIMEAELLDQRKADYITKNMEFEFNPNSSVSFYNQLKQATEDLQAERTQLVLAVEQFLPFVLIVGRWILPAGALSRDKLSQLLLVYIGLAADIIEFLETYKEDPVKFNEQLIYAVLSLWTWSLLQFVFVVTMTREAQDAIDSIEEEEKRVKKQRQLIINDRTCCCYSKNNVHIDPNMNLEAIPGLIIPQRMKDIEIEDNEPKCQCLESEVWGIVVTLCLQDVPFLILRLVLICHFRVYSRTNVFYSFKNALMLSLQVYRLAALHHERNEILKTEREERLKLLESYYTMGGISIIKAVTTRSMFSVHALVSVYHVVDVLDDLTYWAICLSLVALGFETAYTIVKRDGNEWKWFCPSVLFYLCCMVPVVWVLELDILKRRLNADKNSETEPSDDLWLIITEQLLLLVLILGRWILPKGEVTRDQLSQLLLVYIGTAADIIEFMDVLKEPNVRDDMSLICVVLFVWSWSLIQFTLAVTVTKARKSRLAMDNYGLNNAEELAEKRKLKRSLFKRFPKFASMAIKDIVKTSSLLNNNGSETPDIEEKEEEDIGEFLKCLESDFWAIMVTLVLQDGPFLIIRMMLLIFFHVVSYTSIFFTCKNVMVIALLIYRLVVLHNERKDEENSKQTEEMTKETYNIYRTSFGVAYRIAQLDTSTD
ncbi:uncharacterized protein [Antedon mediterranea]|uniref:uncharacterized protein n=1 Tax=Antedon mediterranea TaxID=105859 RepID=UPI003AF40C4D